MFHHRDPSQKKDCIPRLAKSSSLETIKKEIAKCDILCFNCHQKLHYDDRPKRKKIDTPKKKPRSRRDSYNKLNIPFPSNSPEYKALYNIHRNQRLKEERKKPEVKERMKLADKRMEQKCRDYAWQYKTDHPCIKCGTSDPTFLAFHHRDPSTKTAHISKMFKSGMKKLQAEIAKCDILCSNCHAKLHWHERQNKAA